VAKGLWFVLGACAAAGCIGNIGDGESGAVVGPTDDDATNDGVPATVMHRLNRTEYRNTTRDLLSTQLDPAVHFPADDISFGFDNISAVLSIAPVQLELYEQAAIDLAEEALFIATAAQLNHYEAENLTGDNGSANNGAWALVSNGAVTLPFDFVAGDYVVSARVWGQQAGPDPVQVSITVGAQTSATIDVTADANNPQVITTSVTVGAGTQQVGINFLNDYYMPPEDRNLYIDWIEVEGPMGVVSSNPIRDEIVFCDPTDPTCVRDIFSSFASRAWRRPATESEIDALVTLSDVAFEQGEDIERGLELGLRGILLSPHFIFRPELDDDPSSDVPHPLDQYEMASRLSYFLWSSMPDQALFDAAAAGLLQDDAELRSQIDRMLADPKADALVDNFAGQWLLIRSLDDHVPDYATYPDYDDALEIAMKQETQLFFREFVLGNYGLNQLLSAEFTFVNDRLATHYGMSFSGGSQLEMTSLEGDDQRFGLLTHGALLTVTSYPNRTSPVKRGVFVLEHLLCSAPPPPPPGVEGLVEEIDPTASLRERLEQHRSDPACAACHDTMDNIGFGLESYDGIGAFRTIDEQGFAVDSSGVLQGVDFAGAKDMAAIIESDPRFVPCIVEKLFSYALGRGVENEDEPALEAVVTAAAESGYNMPELIKLMVTSKPFRERRGTATEEAP